MSIVGELITLPPLPDLVDDEPTPQDTPSPLPDDDADPIAAMKRNLRFFVSNGRAILEALAALGPDQAEERQSLKRQYLHCVARSQQIATDLAPYCAPRVGPVAYKEPPPKPTSSADALITPDMSAIEAAEVYKRFMRGEI
jgi:hypothetical protein